MEAGTPAPGVAGDAALADAPAHTRATVFGLDVSAKGHLPFLEHAAAGPTGRPLQVVLAAEPATAPAWPQGGEVVCDQREHDGAVAFRIEAHPEAGYLIWGPAYGRQILSGEGTRAVCIPEGHPAEAWQRLLIAQTLPFAAVLQGLEVFHASAVVVAGRALAFVGPSHAGKTSVALELCRRGARFLADDVLAVERVGERLLGHPGTPVAGLDHAEAQRLERTGEPPSEQVVAVNARERIVRVHPVAAPAPLAAVFILDRRPDGPAEPRFEAAADARLLLAATFNSVLTGAQRLREQLEVCALAARHRVERVLAGPGVSAAQLAAAVQRRVGTPT